MPETRPETRPATSRGLSLLGGWQLVVDGETVALGGREQRLCALLALTGTRPRAQVAGTLWPESTDARALASLRRAVAQTHQRAPGLLAADRTSVGLAADVVVDVDDLRGAVSRAGSPDADAGVLPGLTREVLLPGWYDEWVEAHREDLQRQRVGALERLAGRALERGDTALAEDAARAVARIEPLRESASELVIRALLAHQDRAGAVRELERYREFVGAELGVVPSPALCALVESAAVPAQVPAAAPAAVRPAGSPERPAAPRVVIPVPRRAQPPEPPPPPDPLFPTEPAGLSLRAAAGRLAVGAALVIASSLAIANLGPEGDRLDPAPTADRPLEQPTGGRENDAQDAREVLVRPVAAAAGVAAFMVRATLRPARVRLEVAGPSGSNVVRSVVVRSRGGQRLVVGGLDGGTYQWSATSPTAPPVTGVVRVAAEDSPVLAAAGETAPNPDEVSTPTASPTPIPTATPSQTVTPSHQASPTPHPSPTRQPSPTSEPTDPGTEDPGLVG